MDVTADRRGPARLEAGALRRFLEQRRLGALCLADQDGQLRAMPTWIWATGPEQLALIPAERLEGLVASSPACIVADEFESYEAIRGAIVQGRLVTLAADLGDELRVEVTRCVGFSFAGSISSPPPPGDEGGAGSRSEDDLAP